MTKDREQTVILNQEIRVEDVKICLLCGYEGIPIFQNLKDNLFNSRDIWSLMRCAKCDLLWLNPRPLPNEISKLYLEYYTHQQNDSLMKKRATLYKAVKAKILQSGFGYSMNVKSKFLGKVLSYISPLKEIVGRSVMWVKANEGRSLLDIGCGNGQFLAQMKELGWNVFGIEPDSKAARIAREHFGLEIFQGTLEKAKFPANSFDVITMDNVIEHVPDPINLLTECRRILKSGGKLVVITPNIHSLGRRLFSKEWLHFDPPRHLFLFSPKSMSICIDRAKLKVQKLWTTPKTARWILTTNRLIKRKDKLSNGSPSRVNLKLNLEGLMFWGVEYLVSRFWSVGEELVLEAVK